MGQESFKSPKSPNNFFLEVPNWFSYKKKIIQKENSPFLWLKWGQLERNHHNFGYFHEEILGFSQTEVGALYSLFIFSLQLVHLVLLDWIDGGRGRKGWAGDDKFEAQHNSDSSKKIRFSGVWKIIQKDKKPETLYTFLNICKAKAL